MFWFFVWGVFSGGFAAFGNSQETLKTICSASYGGEGTDSFLCYRLWITELLKVYYHLSWLPREVVEAPSLEMLKARLDEALSNLV